MKTSAFANQIEGSKTLAVTARVGELRREGKPIIGLGAGEPDFPTPKAICDAAKNAIDAGYTKYTANAGIVELREKIANYLNKLGGNYTANEIVVSSGAKPAILNALFATCNPGDEVLLPAPYWTSYPEQVKMAGAKPIILQTTEATEFKITANQLKNAITAKTRVLIFNSPSNPTGAVYSTAEIDAIVAVVKKAGIYIISDEIYIELVYDNVQTRSLSSYREIAEQLLLVNGLSKAYSMTGWRVGYLAAKQPVIGAVNRIQSHYTSNACTISQYASVAAFDLSKEIMDAMKAEFTKRRDYVFNKFSSINGISVPKPQGAFYIFPNVSSFFGKSHNGVQINTAMELSTFLLETANSAVVPGEAFGAPENIRVSYATSMENLKSALDQIENALSRLR
ncbi:MAG: pyridoxal phosphate-dependent aminotransferase [Calditrichaeota bacterium]|nr:MAG: pyridoxal phosphate-dependent aminotransferase [Calditrichota bacterium]